MTIIIIIISKNVWEFEKKIHFEESWNWMYSKNAMFLEQYPVIQIHIVVQLHYIASWNVPAESCLPSKVFQTLLIQNNDFFAVHVSLEIRLWSVLVYESWEMYSLKEYMYLCMTEWLINNLNVIFFLMFVHVFTSLGEVLFLSWH